MKPLELPQGSRFTNKQIIAFLLPIFFEQLMVAGLNIADTFMVSFFGDVSVAGVALVARIDNFVKTFFSALAQGGSVVMSQYIGAQNSEKSRLSMKNNIRIVTIIGIVIMLVMVLFRPQILQLLYGKADAGVLAVSNDYFTVTALSYPFVALYYANSASFRAMGESKIPSMFAIAMMVLNLILKYIFLFVMRIGIKGAALSTLVSMAVTGLIMFFILHSKKNKVPLEGFFKPDFKKENVFRILRVSVPNGIENGMFQLGALLIAGLVSGLGQVAIAADHQARTICALVHSMGTAFVAVMMMLIGQCMGAGKPDEARMYKKHILKLDYIFTFINVVIFLVILRPVISLFGVSEEVKDTAVNILILYSVCSVFFYPTSFAVAGALRGTGDTKFVMMVSTCSMFIFRIGAAYFFVKVMDMGIMGTWVAMVSDWVIRSSIFHIRFKKGKWQDNKVI